MTLLLLARLLRVLAIAIVVAALVDPVVSIERLPATPIVLVDLAAADVTPIATALQRLDPDADLAVRATNGDRLPCAPAERCVVVADGSLSAEPPGDLQSPLAVVRLDNASGANVRVTAVVASSPHTSAGGVARVTVEGRGVAGRRSEIRVADRDAIVGTAFVDWKADGTQAIDVPWWPLAAGPRSLRFEVLTPEDVVSFDNAVDVGVDVGVERLPVLVFDARPSWGSTFVRRALEDDARFLVEHRARLAPAITAGTANGRLDVRALDLASVLIVGGGDALTAADADLIDRFVRVRGGSVIYLPERAPAGPLARLIDGQWVERLTAEAQASGPLRAAELLVYQPKGGHHAVIASAGELPVIVAVPSGAGRVVVSGAMDAWRYRDADAGAFDRFWRSVAAEGAAAGARVRLEFDRDLAAPGSRHTFIVRYRSMTPVSSVDASAVARCGQDAAAIRLWPAGAPGAMRGEVSVGQDGCTVEAVVNDVPVTAAMAVTPAPSRPVADTVAALENQARASGGVVTDKDNLAAIARHTSSVSGRAPMWPMRSAWWMLPFAGCLSLEWWLRRRNGLR